MNSPSQPIGHALEEIGWKAPKEHFSAEELHNCKIWFEEFGRHGEAEDPFDSLLAEYLYHASGENWPHTAKTAAVQSQLILEASEGGDVRVPMLYHTALRPPVVLKGPQKAA